MKNFYLLIFKILKFKNFKQNNNLKNYICINYIIYYFYRNKVFFLLLYLK